MWPGVSVHHACELKPCPLERSTVTHSDHAPKPLGEAVAKSVLPSPSKSPVITRKSAAPPLRICVGVGLCHFTEVKPAPVESSIEIHSVQPRAALGEIVARSERPSPLKSPETIR